MCTWLRAVGPVCDGRGPSRWEPAATKESNFSVCVVDSQIVLTTQVMQSWASPSVLLSPPRPSSTLTRSLRPVRTEEAGLTASTAAAAAASSPPSPLRVGARNRGGLGRRRPFRFASSPPSSSSSYHPSWALEGSVCRWHSGCLFPPPEYTNSSDQ